MADGFVVYGMMNRDLPVCAATPQKYRPSASKLHSFFSPPMTAKDIFHDVVKVALQKDGWTITHDPFVLEWEERQFAIDLAADRLNEVHQDIEKIAVIVKSFIGATSALKFPLALVEFLNARSLLQRYNRDRDLYLAVPIQNYTGFLQDSSLQKSLKDARVQTIVFDPSQKAIVEWIE